MLEPSREDRVPRKEVPNPAATEPPVSVLEAERTTTEFAPAPVEADIVETALASTEVETELSDIESREAIEDAPKETKEEPKETEHPADVVEEKVQDESKGMFEVAHCIAKEDMPSRTLEIPLDAPAPAPAPDRTLASIPAESKGSISVPAQAEEISVAVHNGNLGSETIVEIPDEMVVTEKEEEVEFVPEMESPVEDKVEGRAAQAREKVPATAPLPATESDHVSPS